MFVTNAEKVAFDVVKELSRAQQKHPTPFNSAHEGYAIILEELDEVKEEVWKGNPNPLELRAELVQVAAMAMRMIIDLNL